MNINEKEVRKYLLKIGIKSDALGFHYILDAVRILQKQQIHTNMATVYEMIMKKYKLDGHYSQIERSIRHSKILAYKNGTVLKEIYDAIPNNKTFLYDIVFNFDILKEACK